MIKKQIDFKSWGKMTFTTESALLRATQCIVHHSKIQFLSGIDLEITLVMHMYWSYSALMWLAQNWASLVLNGLEIFRPTSNGPEMWIRSDYMMTKGDLEVPKITFSKI